jgi:hypothetical protein
LSVAVVVCTVRGAEVVVVSIVAVVVVVVVVAQCLYLCLCRCLFALANLLSLKLNLLELCNSRYEWRHRGPVVSGGVEVWVVEVCRKCRVADFDGCVVLI